MHHDSSTWVIRRTCSEASECHKRFGHFVARVVVKYRGVATRDWNLRRGIRSPTQSTKDFKIKVIVLSIVGQFRGAVVRVENVGKERFGWRPFRFPHELEVGFAVPEVLESGVDAVKHPARVPHFFEPLGVRCADSERIWCPSQTYRQMREVGGVRMSGDKWAHN
jgi:hypothetical protein